MAVENELTELQVIDDFMCYCFGKTLKYTTACKNQDNYIWLFCERRFR
jgi:hypothetical protein